MNKTVDCTNTRITRLKQDNNFNEPSKYALVKKTGRVEFYMLFGLMYIIGIRGVNLHMTDTLLSNDSHFPFGPIISKCQKPVSDFRKDHICFGNFQERTYLF